MLTLVHCELSQSIGRRSADKCRLIVQAIELDRMDSCRQIGWTDKRLLEIDLPSRAAFMIIIVCGGLLLRLGGGEL